MAQVQGWVWSRPLPLSSAVLIWSASTMCGGVFAGMPRQRCVEFVPRRGFRRWALLASLLGGNGVGCPWPVGGQSRPEVCDRGVEVRAQHDRQGDEEGGQQERDRRGQRPVRVAGGSPWRHRGLRGR